MEKMTIDDFIEKLKAIRIARGNLEVIGLNKEKSTVIFSDIYVNENKVVIEEKNLSSKELMDYNKENSIETLIYFKDFVEFRIEIKKNANGYFYRIIAYNDDNILDEEVYNSSNYYSYFERDDIALEMGKNYLKNIYFEAGYF